MNCFNQWKAIVKYCLVSILRMRTHLEFRSAAFPSYPGEDEEINPGRHGKRLAEFLAQELPTRGFRTTGIFAEDWGWGIGLEHDAFPLWIGCGNYEEYDDGFLCFIEPSEPYVRRFFARIPTTETVDRLATALDSIIRDSGKANEMRWWTETEVSRG